MTAVDVFLETERLILRRFTMDDANLLFALDNDPDVMRFANPGVPVTREEIVEGTLPAFMAYYERLEGYGLIEKGFTELSVQRVTAQAMAANIGSRRVMEKAGLRDVRSFHADWPVRIPDDEQADVECALDQAEFE